MHLFSRSDPDYVCRVLGEVIKAGATTLNIPDTVGYTIPKEFGELIAYLRKNTEGAENVIFSTHCQNDLGLATGNTLAVSSADVPLFCVWYKYGKDPLHGLTRSKGFVRTEIKWHVICREAGYWNRRAWIVC